MLGMVLITAGSKKAEQRPIIMATVIMMGMFSQPPRAARAASSTAMPRRKSIRTRMIFRLALSIRTPAKGAMSERGMKPEARTMPMTAVEPV